MKKRFSLLLALCVTVSVAWAQNPSRENILENSLVDTPYLIVESTTFGVFTPKGFEATKRVTHRDGQNFEWLIGIYSNIKNITYREVFTLPKAPKTWGVSSNTTLSKDRKIATVVHESGDTPYLYGSWSLSPGDPKGHHQIRVYVEDRLLHTFDFEVK